MLDILSPRLAYKPFEYPQIEKFVDGINSTFWSHKEVEFDDDIHDFKIKLDDTERYIIGTILKTFTQTEVHVADEFWSKIGNYFPKPEIIEAAATFTENEWRHAKAYSRLNEVLGLDDFDAFLQDEIALERFENLTRIRKDYGDKPNVQDIMRTLAIFGGFTEGVNLFSQFAILKSFSSNGRNLLTNIGNIIDWSQKDENLHSLCAIFLFNILKNERPEEFTEELKDSIKEAARLTFNIEIHLLDQIFSQGELPNLKKAELINFMKDRINRSLTLMEIETIYEIDEELLKSMEWFYDGFIAQEHSDFFYHRPTAYTKHTKVYDSNNVFVSREEIESIKK